MASHRQYKTPEYRCYISAKSRCNNPNLPEYQYYGGRGIEFRFSSFPEFLESIGPRPSRRHSIDRINNDGHYEPGNVRWATQIEQLRNRRDARWVTLNGITKTFLEWCAELGVSSTTAQTRITKRGWCANCAFTIKPHGGKCPHI
jgi:hypothetical protein